MAKNIGLIFLHLVVGADFLLMYLRLMVSILACWHGLAVVECDYILCGTGACNVVDLDGADMAYRTGIVCLILNRVTKASMLSSLTLCQFVSIPIFMKSTRGI